MKAEATHHINLGVRVAHIAHDAAILHAVQVLASHHVLVACPRGAMESETRSYRQHDTTVK